MRTVVDVACVSRPESRGVPTETRTEIPGESMLIYKRTNADVPFTLAREIKPGACVRTEVRYARGIHARLSGGHSPLGLWT